MRTRVWIAAASSLFVLASLATAQPPRKPGLWETTATMTWQKSPFPQGMQMPPQAAAAFGGGAPHTVQVCLSQEWIDKFGGPMAQSRGDCKTTNTSMTPTGMTGTLVCSGQMTGTGTVEAEWSIAGTAKGKVHFTGTMQMGRNGAQGAGIPVEWTNEFTSVYKGPDCGSVKPTPIPAD